MNVVFFASCDEQAVFAEMAAESLRLTNPEAKAYVLTDPKTQFKTLIPVRGYISLATLMIDRTIGQLHFLREHKQALFLDSDCLVSHDLTGLFKGPVAVTDRVPPKGAATHIYNGGVLYGDGQGTAISFWTAFVETYQYIQRDAWGWYGDQAILASLVPQFGDSVNVYPPTNHNYVPTQLYECSRVLPAHIVHFKGEKRKHWMPLYLQTLRKHYGAQGLRRSA